MLMKHYKDAQGNLYGFAADGSQDHIKPEGLTELSLVELQTKSALLGKAHEEKIISELDYYRQRIRFYPNIGEFVDAWVKGDNAALEQYRQECLAVKAKYPKPEGF